MTIKHQIKPVTQRVLTDDEHVLEALTKIPTYQPVNPDLTSERLVALKTVLAKAHDAKTALETSLMAADDAYATASWAFHDAILQAKTQVKAQFGPDSVEIQSIGLKRTSERKRPVKKTDKKARVDGDRPFHAPSQPT